VNLGLKPTDCMARHLGEMRPVGGLLKLKPSSTQVNLVGAFLIEAVSE
jgi:hypothetical protein